MEGKLTAKLLLKNLDYRHLRHVSIFSLDTYL